MDIQWAPILTFLLVASITPGPNNLTAAAMGMRSGFRKAFLFALGVYFGVALLLILVGFLKMAISDFFFQWVWVFKVLGSAYLLWLAFGMVRKSGGIDTDRSDVSFFQGIMLQLVNPKGLFFAMTMHFTFLTEGLSPMGILAVGFGFPLVTIVCVSTWGFAGSFLARYLENPRHRRIFYWIMALLLIYTVITILTKEFNPV